MLAPASGLHLSLRHELDSTPMLLHTHDSVMAPVHCSSNIPKGSTWRSAADVIPQVIDYLLKKGYTKTEETLREESKTLEDIAKGLKPASVRIPTEKYSLAYRLLKSWVESNLDIYKVSQSASS